MPEPIPKPTPRGRKPRRPIARGRRPAKLRRRANLGPLRQLADDLMSLFVRHRGGWICQRCGSRDWRRMQCAHLIRKGTYAALRFRPDAAICLCDACHSFFTWHDIEWREWLLGFLGEPRLRALELQARIRTGPHDYAAEILFYVLALRKRSDLWMVQERFDELLDRGRRLGVPL